MKHTAPLVALLLFAGGQTAAPRIPKATPPPFNVVEASIADMQAAMKAGRTTSHEIVQQYLTRIATYEDLLHAAITVNPHALEDADALDRERAQGRVRGPLHGIPIALKDNIHTTDMPTTGGALAFVGLVPPYEATLTKNLRDAGAIIIAKTGTDRARQLRRRRHADQLQRRSRLRLQPVRSAPRPADDRRRPAGAADRRIELRHRHGGELLGRQRRHRDVGLDPEPVEPEHARGDQADGRPHQPLRRHPDHRRSGHAGPDGEVRDATSRSCSARSRARRPIRTIRRRRRARRRRAATTRSCCSADGLKGARIGIPRANYYDPITLPGSDRPRGGLNPDQKKVMDEAIAALKAQGAVVVDVDIPSIVAAGPEGQPAARRAVERPELRDEARLQHVAGVARDRRRR